MVKEIILKFYKYVTAVFSKKRAIATPLEKLKSSLLASSVTLNGAELTEQDYQSLLGYLSEEMKRTGKTLDELVEIKW